MCPATPRDLGKPRAERLAEVFYSQQLQAGQANAQQIISGLTVVSGSTKTKFTVEPGEYAPDGVSLPVSVSQVANVTLNTAAKPEAGQFCYVLIEVNAAGEVFQTVSAITAGTPVLPALTAGRIAIAYLSLKGAFTPGTTEIKAENVVPVLYSAGNESPIGGF